LHPAQAACFICRQAIERFASAPLTERAKTMDKVIGEPLFYVYLIYGISFLLIGFLILKEAVGASLGPIIGAFYILAFFGIVHGLAELTDWVRFIRRALGAPDMEALRYVSQGFLILSFVILLQFGINLLTCQSAGKGVRALRVIPTLGLAIFLAAVVARGMSDVLAVGLLARWGFGFTGSAVSAIALAVTAQTMKPLENSKLVSGMRLAAAGFGFYAIFGGLLVGPIGAMPIQLFRAVCAVTIALSSFSVIDVFKYVRRGAVAASS
jgi:hypothetical protein